MINYDDERLKPFISGAKFEMSKWFGIILQHTSLKLLALMQKNM